MKKLTCMLLALVLILAAVSFASAEDYSGKKITVTYNPDDTWNDIIKNYAAAAVAEAFPGLEVEYYENDSTSLSLLAQTGDMPDIYYGAISSQYLEADLIVPLNDYIDEEWLNAAFSNPNFFYAPNGLMYTIASGSDCYYTGAFYYNKQMFEENDINVPTNFDELLEAAKAFLDLGVERPIAFSSDMFMQSLLQECLTMLAPEAIDDLCSNKTDYNDPRIVEAFAKFQELFDIKAFGKGIAEIDNTMAIAMFNQGGIPMVYTMSWNSASVAEAPFEVGVTFIGAEDGKQYSQWGSFSTGWFMTRDTEDRELSAEVIKVLVDSEAKRNFAQGIVTNYKVDGQPVFLFAIDAERDALYNGVETWHNWLLFNCCDTPNMLAIMQGLSNIYVEDVASGMEDYRLALQTAWETNTFFDLYK